MPKAADPVRPAQKAPARMSKKDPLTKEQVRAIDAWWRAANYLSACQLYLLDNPLLREPLKEEHLKRTIVGYWGTCPGQNFIYTHLNRAIVKYDLDMISVAGPRPFVLFRHTCGERTVAGMHETPCGCRPEQPGAAAGLVQKEHFSGEQVKKNFQRACAEEP